MKYYTLTLLFFLVSLKTLAQEPIEVIHSVGITIFDEHNANPFGSRTNSPTHLGGTISFEMSKKRDGIYQFTHIFQAGYYYHKNFNQVAFISWKPKFELRFSKLFNIHAILGAGYAHSFPTETSYKLDDGEYKKKTNLGKPHFMPSVGFGAGLHLNKLLGIPVEVFARYEMFSLAPYAINGSVPITLNTMTSFGIKYSFN